MDTGSLPWIREHVTDKETTALNERNVVRALGKKQDAILYHKYHIILQNAKDLSTVR